jgi:hypothetical protein
MPDSAAGAEEGGAVDEKKEKRASDEDVEAHLAHKDPVERPFDELEAKDEPEVEGHSLGRPFEKPFEKPFE